MTDQLCKACGQLLPNARGRRFCAICGRPLLRHDKWFFGPDGRTRHKDCDNPEGDIKPTTQTELLEAR